MKKEISKRLKTFLIGQLNYLPARFSRCQGVYRQNLLKHFRVKANETKHIYREKESHSRHLRQLEEEMEVQMTRVESRVRTEEKEKADSEKEELRRQLEAEIAELRSNLNRLQKVRILCVKTMTKKLSCTCCYEYQVKIKRDIRSFA